MNRPTVLRLGIGGGMLALAIVTAGHLRGAAAATKTATPQALQPASIGHIGHLDYRNGFRRWRFGASNRDFPGLKLAQNAGGIKAYTIDGDDLQIGDAHLQRIVYHFVDDRFMGVSLFTKGRHDSHAMLDVLQAAYGPGIRPHKDQNEYWWRGHVANARYSEDGPPDDESEVWIGNNALQDLSSRYQKATIDRAATSI